MNLDAKILDSSYRLVVVPSQRLTGKCLWGSDVKTINDMPVVDFYTFTRDDAFPGGLIMLASGVRVTGDQFWAKYRKSERMYIFIVNTNSEKT